MCGNGQKTGSGYSFTTPWPHYTSIGAGIRAFIEIACGQAILVDDKRRTIEHHPLVPRCSKLMAVNRGDGVWVQLMENG
eukprot:6471284-Amphidinium_carterae.1